MTFLELILLCLVIAESMQLGAVLYNMVKLRKNVEAITKDPQLMGDVLNAMIFGFMERVKDKPEDQERFFGFISVCGMAAWEGVKSQMMGPKADGSPGEGLSGIDLSFLPKKMRGLVQLLDHPLVKNMIDKKMQGGGSAGGDGGGKSVWGL